MNHKTYPDSCWIAGPGQELSSAVKGRARLLRSFPLWAFAALLVGAGRLEVKAAEHSCCKGEALEDVAFSKASLYHFDGVLTDDSGRTVALSDLKGQRVVVAMFFSSCTSACPALLGDLAQLEASFAPGEAPLVVMVSFDSERDTVEALAAFRRSRELGPSWRLYRGDAATVRELAALLGVNYRRETSGQFAHTNLLTCLNEAGEVIYQRKGLNGQHAEIRQAFGHAASP